MFSSVACRHLLFRVDSEKWAAKALPPPISPPIAQFLVLINFLKQDKVV